jgi:hypothetical protein
MKRRIFLSLMAILLLAACSNQGSNAEPADIPDDTPVEYYAVLAQKDSYADVKMTALLVDYIDIKRLRGALEELGWPAENIHEVREFDKASLKAELDWLEETADENDLVFFYVTGHGTYLRNHIDWATFFPDEWAEINSLRRVLMVDSCTAAEFTQALQGDPNPYLALAAVDEDEYGWKGIEEEGLPIIGGIFTFYFVEAIEGSRADLDGDGFVSVQEAAEVAEEKQRTYLHEIVFGVDAFVEMYHDIGVRPEKDKTFPDVIVDDYLGYPLDLRVGSNK